MRVLPWILLQLAAGFALLVEGGFLGRAVPPRLEALAGPLGALTILEPIPVEEGALGEQPPERWAYRRVRDDQGHEGRLFVAWYARAQRWSGRPHDVQRCFEALGWRELEAERLDEAHRPWSRRYARAGREIRVVHWLERPGPDDDRLTWREIAARACALRGFRPDVASLYLEFEAEAAPDPRTAARIVAALSQALESSW